MNPKKEFPNWKKLYDEVEVEKMPWYFQQLDPDIESALSTQKILTGECLDLGTGPGTQAIALAQKGFLVTATDVSQTAIERLKKNSEQKKLGIKCLVDDILGTKLKQTFDFILDRGVFHIFTPELRKKYIGTISTMIKTDGYLFLKCFSVQEARDEGPYKFSPQMIAEYFNSQFMIHDCFETVYYGTLDPLPKALFTILQKK